MECKIQFAGGTLNSSSLTKGQCGFYSSVCLLALLIRLPSEPYLSHLLNPAVVSSEDALLIRKRQNERCSGRQLRSTFLGSTNCRSASFRRTPSHPDRRQQTVIGQSLSLSAKLSGSFTRKHQELSFSPTKVTPETLCNHSSTTSMTLQVTNKGFSRVLPAIVFFLLRTERRQKGRGAHDFFSEPGYF